MGAKRSSTSRPTRTKARPKRVTTASSGPDRPVNTDDALRVTVIATPRQIKFEDEDEVKVVHFPSAEAHPAVRDLDTGIRMVMLEQVARKLGLGPSDLLTVAAHAWHGAFIVLHTKVAIDDKRRTFARAIARVLRVADRSTFMAHISALETKAKAILQTRGEDIGGKRVDAAADMRQIVVEAIGNLREPEQATSDTSADRAACIADRIVTELVLELRHNDAIKLPADYDSSTRCKQARREITEILWHAERDKRGESQHRLKRLAENIVRAAMRNFGYGKEQTKGLFKARELKK